MNPGTDVAAFGLTLLIMLVGLFGLIIPLFPGVLVMWLGALLYGLAMGFHTLGIVIFVLITLLAIAGMLVDNLLMGIGARKGGASWVTMAIATVAGLAGTVFFPPFGGLIATPAAVLLLELWRARDLRRALGATGGLAAGWGLSFIARFGIGVVMILLWGVWAWPK